MVLLTGGYTAVIKEGSLFLDGGSGDNFVGVVYRIRGGSGDVTCLADVPDGVLLLRGAQEVQDRGDDTLNEGGYVENVVAGLRARTLVGSYADGATTIITGSTTCGVFLCDGVPGLSGVRWFQRESAEGVVVVVAVSGDILRRSLVGGTGGVLLGAVRLGAVDIAVNGVRGNTGFDEFAGGDEVPFAVLVHIEAVREILAHLAH